MHREARLTQNAAAASLALAATLAQATDYQLQTLALAGVGIQAFDINNANQVVGSVNRGAAGGNAFIWQAGSYTFFDGPAGAFSSVFLGISDNGVAVGSWNDTVLDDLGAPVAGATQGLIHEAGAYTSFNIPGATFTQLRGVSPDGRYISGYYQDELPATPFQVPFVHDRNNGTTTLLYHPSSTGGGIAQGINASGVVTGGDTLQVPGQPAARPGFEYQIGSGTFSYSEVAGSTNTRLRDIDSAGTVAGWATVAGGVVRGFVGSAASPQYIDVFGSTNVAVQGINDAGWVSGNYLEGGVFYGFVATPVPEPAPALLLATGLALLAWRKRRQPA